MGYVRQAFRVSDEQATTRQELAGESFDQLHLRGPVEIDHHIATENQMASMIEDGVEIKRAAC